MTNTRGQSSVSFEAGLFSWAEDVMKDHFPPRWGEGGAMEAESASARETVSRRRGGAQ